MALIDVVKYDINPNEFVYKVPSSALRLGTQLIVMPEQIAFMVKSGQRMDVFSPGTHTLETKNVPILSRLINLPFGGASPFEAEVWYVNLLSKLDNKWGTDSPIRLEDPKYKVLIHVRAYGQFGLKIKDPALFLDSLVGALPNFSAEKVITYFRGKIMSTVISLLSAKMVKDNLSVLELPAMLEELSSYCNTKLNEVIAAKYGVEVVDFSFMSVNTPEDDPGLVALEAAKEKAMYISTVGRDVYSFDSSINVMDKAASNTGAGGVMGSGMGMGMGVSLGTTMGTQMGGLSQQINTNLDNKNTTQENIQPPPRPSVVSFYIIINDEQQGPLPASAIGDMILKRSIARDAYVWRQGMAEWAAADAQPELKQYFEQLPPPPPPKKK